MKRIPHGTCIYRAGHPLAAENLDAGLARAAVTDLPFAMALWAVFVGAGPRQGRLRRRHDVIRVGLIDMAES